MSDLFTEIGFALAKINLCLHVIGQRRDGYHLLDSLVAFAGIGDRLSATYAGSGHSLVIDGPFAAGLPTDGRNLILRAAEMVAPGAALAFHLEKHLPPASGIGGGSSDAAATIRLLHGSIYRSALPDAATLADLGADVPVCLTAPAPMRMRGIGERLDPVAGLPAGGILLANPGVEVSTPAIFKRLVHKQNSGLPDVLPVWPDMAALALWLQDQRNDLEAPAIAEQPVIGAVIDALWGLPRCLFARMSGSGATCFALFSTEDGASSAAETLRESHPEWWIEAGRLAPSA